MFFLNPPIEDMSQGWLLTILSSALCVLGCFVIFLDDIYYWIVPKWVSSRYPFQIRENYAFMNGLLAFSSGCLLLTALYRLLPEAMAHFKMGGSNDNYNMELVASFVGGITICGLFNQGLHMLTTESVVHCSHDGETHGDEELGHDHGHSETHKHKHKHSHSHSHDEESNIGDETHSHSHGSEGLTSSEQISTFPKSASAEDVNSHLHHHDHTGSHEESENSPLLALDAPPQLSRKKSLMHFLAHGSTEEESLLGECKGYTSAELCHYEQNGGLHFCEVPQLRKSELADDPRLERVPVESHGANESLWDRHSHHKAGEHHHHHVNSPMSRLLLIGVQTILAITLHKFPEGFITYITLKTNPQLGVSIFLSLLIHNYTEGFSMCLPLYYSFGESKWRKWKAVGISAFLGGLSQPAGAFFGYLFLNHLGEGNVDVDKLNFVFGVSMAMTAGFLTVIALSMYGSAVSFSGLPNFVCIWSLLGMCTIGILTIFTGSD